MIIDTVKDYRVLLDWLDQQHQFDHSRTAVAGYSMGGQVSMLLAGVDSRIEQVLAIVPPYLTNTTALVAPKNIAEKLAVDKIWLVTANDDEYADKEDNESLFTLIASDNKKHLQFDGGHILPEGYYQQLSDWFSN